MSSLLESAGTSVFELTPVSAFERRYIEVTETMSRPVVDIAAAVGLDTCNSATRIVFVAGESDQWDAMLDFICDNATLVNFTCQNRNGSTALHLLAYTLNTAKGRDVMERVVRNKAITLNVDAADTNGNTAAHIAAFIGCDTIIDLLRHERGARLDIKNKRDMVVLCDESAETGDDAESIVIINESDIAENADTAMIGHAFDQTRGIGPTQIAEILSGYVPSKIAEAYPLVGTDEIRVTTDTEHLTPKTKAAIRGADAQRVQQQQGGRRTPQHDRLRSRMGVRPLNTYSEMNDDDDEDEDDDERSITDTDPDRGSMHHGRPDDDNKRDSGSAYRSRTYSIARSKDRNATNVHAGAIRKIMKNMLVDEPTARAYKAVIYEKLVAKPMSFEDRTSKLDEIVSVSDKIRAMASAAEVEAKKTEMNRSPVSAEPRKTSKTATKRPERKAKASRIRNFSETSPDFDFDEV